MADERSVDVDERKDPEPGSGRSPRRPIAAAVTLTPVQEAYGRIAAHALQCPCCRDVDRDIDERCDVAERLWRTYHSLTDGAFRRLASD